MGSLMSYNILSRMLTRQSIDVMIAFYIVVQFLTLGSCGYKDLKYLNGSACNYAGQEEIKLQQAPTGKGGFICD
jgi:hypothetical protein